VIHVLSLFVPAVEFRGVPPPLARETGLTALSIKESPQDAVPLRATKYSPRHRITEFGNQARAPPVA
jgi:hypothetical protein